MILTYLLVGCDMSTKFDFTESTFPDRFAEDVLANLSLIGFQLDVRSFLVRHGTYLVRITDGLVDFFFLALRQRVRSHNCVTIVEEVDHGSGRVLGTTRQIGRLIQTLVAGTCDGLMLLCHSNRANWVRE